MKKPVSIGLSLLFTIASTSAAVPSAACKKMTRRDDAYAFKLRVQATSGYFKVNVGTGPTHGECPDFRVEYIGKKILSGDSTRYKSIRNEACFAIGEGGDTQALTVEWDVVVPFVPDTGLVFETWPGGTGSVDVTVLDFAGQEWLHKTFSKSTGTLQVTRDKLPPPGGLRAVLGAKPVLAPKMGAYYFPWYGTVEGPTGAVVHWDAGPFLYTPTLGHYDSGDPKVIDQHMAWAKEANLNLFVVSYWDQEHSNQNMAPILAGAGKAGLEISAMIETVTRRAGTPRENFLAQIKEILAQYAINPAWLKAEGRPILFVYDRVRTEMQAASGNAWWSDWLWVKSQVDSSLILMLPIDTASTPQQVKAMGGGFAFAANTGAGNPWVGGDNDDATWTWLADRGQGISAVPILPGFKRLRTAADVPNYRNQWRGSREAMPDIILVNSWNEYHESSVIEPTVEFGKQYLDITGQEAALFCAGQLGDLADPNATVSPMLPKQGFSANRGRLHFLGNEGGVALGPLPEGTSRVVIFNLQGRRIRSLAIQRADEAWDGLDGQGRRAPQGLYLFTPASAESE